MMRRLTASESRWGRTLCVAALLLGIAFAGQPALARSHHHHAVHASAHKARFAWHRSWHAPARHASRGWVRTANWGPTDPAKDAELVEDGRTGRILFARNADAQRHPASLTKMMTLYMLFEALRKGQVNMNTPIYISQHAAWQKPTKLGLPAGDSLPVEMAIRSAVVISANDIAVAIAEALGGTESHFAELMTQKAHELGMRNTFYHNASGLPDDRQITTASDLGILAHHLAYDFPQYFHYFSLPGFTFRGRVHMGHDNLLGRYVGADGIKTGYTNGSGFNLVSSVVRGGAHVIGIVMGGYSAHRRDLEMMRLLDQTFAQINAQPNLVARAEVPWQNMAIASNAAPVVAGFQFGTSQPANMRPYAAPAPNGGEMDEDSAESRPDDDEIAKIITAAPKPQIGVQQQRPPVAPAAKPQTNMAMINAPAQVSFPKVQPAPPPTKMPGVTPLPRDNAVPVSLASLQPQSFPQVAPTPRGNAIDESRMPEPKPASGSLVANFANAASGAERDWTIQIGAFNDVPTARAELSAYAEKSADKLRQAERIIVPYTGTGGKTMYRARFGKFAEDEARAICITLTHEGHSCFASTLTR
jgi:D-alanyl-D-alanine carboxypeptidase